MARTASLRSLLEQARRYSDMVGSDFVSDPELQEWLNQSYAELYTLLIQSGCDYFLDSEEVTVTAATDLYDLPDDFMSLRGVDIDFGDGTLEAEPFVFAQRHTYAGETAGLGGYTATLWYHPNPPRMNGDGDEIDGVAGWEEYVVLGAAIKALDKEESDSRALVMRQQAKLQEILGAVAQRDAGHPDKVTDVYATPCVDFGGAAARVRYRLHGASQIRFIAYRAGDSA